jgi:YihY family inner membrane protein
MGRAWERVIGPAVSAAIGAMIASPAEKLPHRPRPGSTAGNLTSTVRRARWWKPLMLKAASKIKVVRQTLVRAVKKFMDIDGPQRAAAFAYYALFSLFPLVVLFVTVGSFFVDRDAALEVIIGYLERYIPLEPRMEHGIFETITGIIEARGQVGAVASVILLWGSLQFFRALVRATNRAWNTDVHNWWQMPAKGILLLAVLGSALLLGLAIPAVARLAEAWLPSAYGLIAWATNFAIAVVPVVVLFYGIAFFYRLAPRRPTQFSEVWGAALIATFLLRLLETGFLLYLENFGKFNVVYGTFGGIMALLMWIFLSGSVVIFGACLSAAHAEVKDSFAHDQQR